MKIVLPVNCILEGNPDYSASLDALWMTALKIGGTAILKGELASISVSDHNTGMITVGDISSIVLSAGGEVEGMSGFLKFTAAAAQQPVPDSLPNSTTPDGNPVNWIDYHNDLNEVWQDADGSHWISTNPFGVRLLGSQILIADGAQGVSFKSVAEFKAAFPDQN
jgi:hypothetical protein